MSIILNKQDVEDTNIKEDYPGTNANKIKIGEMWSSKTKKNNFTANKDLGYMSQETVLDEMEEKRYKSGCLT